MKHLAIILILIVSSIIISGDHLFNSPNISDNGQYILFNFNDDIYKCSINGGDAVQITVNPGYDGSPAISQDGRYMAFSSDRNNVERKIFLMDMEKNTIEQITFGRGYDYPLFIENDRIVFRSYYRSYGAFIYSVDVAGGVPEQYYYGPSGSMSISDSIAAYVYGKIGSTRYKYRGSADYDIYIKDMKNDRDAIKFTDNEWHDIQPRIIGNHVYYLSAEKGIYRIVMKDIQTGKMVEITDNDENIFYFDIDKDENTIVYESRFGIYRMNIAEQSTERISINILPDRVIPSNDIKTLSKISDFSVSPANDSMLIINTYGELFIYYPEIINDNITNNIAWDRDPIFCDSQSYYFTSNRDDVFDIYKGYTDGNIERITHTALPEEIMLISDEETGNYNKVIVFKTPEALYLYEKNKIMKIDSGQVHNAVISPNHRYIAYSKMNMDGQSYSVDNMYIYDRDNKSIRRISETGFTMKPVMFSKDCKRLYFTFSTNIERLEYYTELYYMDLVKPITEYKQFAVTDSAAADIDVDFNGLYDRKHKIGDARDIVMAMGSHSRDFLVYVVRGEKDKFYKLSTVMDRGVYNYEPELLFETDHVSKATISPNSNSIFFIVNDRLMKSGIGAQPVPVPFTAQLLVNEQERFMELYNEAWLILNDYFYDDDFHGNDWEQIKAKFKPLVQNAESFSDMSDIVYRMFGDLNASHLAFREGGSYGLPYGDLGIEYTEENGYPRISYIFSGGALDRYEIDAKPGDYIIQINGNDLKNRDAAEFLLNTVGKKVILTIADSPNGKQREYTVIPADMWDSYYKMYDRWVKRREFLTDSMSNGTIGYIHIRSMGNTDFWKFQDKILFANANKQGLVLDVRNNGGGFSYDYYITFFSRQAHLLKYGRYDNMRQTTPLLRWDKPVIMLINESSFSNAEMFPYVFRQLGIGKVVGMPTAGGVIGTYNTRLFDGTLYRIPALGVYGRDGSNLENNPTEPDIFVDNPPEDYRDDQDTQLKRAIEELLK